MNVQIRTTHCKINTMIATWIVEGLYEFLERKHGEYNRPEFIARDPISVAHQFTLQQDREIMGFWAAMLSWGWRPTILRKAQEIIDLMGGEPYKFITEHKPQDLKGFLDFKHRTFNAVDTLFFIEFFQRYYKEHTTLEDAFLPPYPSTERTLPSRFNNEDSGFNLYMALEKLNQLVFAEDHLYRTRKHISRPSTGSTCKRLNMFLRWMVRKDSRGVDFGIWNRIDQRNLAIPLDLHVDRVSRKLGLITRKQRDWKTVEELTGRLAEFDPDDPVKYDFALFSLGIEEHM